MLESEKSLYVTNTWKGLITQTARKQFEKEGWIVDGNWLNGKDLSPTHKVVLAAPAFFDGALVINPEDIPSSRIFAHILYPDEIVGWNFETGSYQKERQEAFTSLLENYPILSHSRFSLELVTSVYREFMNQDRSVTYLPIEFNKIFERRMKFGKRAKTSISVLWNHMWRSDKGFRDALIIINALSHRYSDAEFVIGRENSWGANPDTESIKQQTRELLQQLQSRNNVQFQRSFSSNRLTNYWQFLAQFDIGFSVSYQEGFGLSMLEQGAAGVACVVPSRECYPEIHRGTLITDNVAEGLAGLIENSQRRKEIAQGGIENASKFNAEDWAHRILEKIS